MVAILNTIGVLDGAAANASPDIFARKLHERSFLLFEYQGPDGQVTRCHLPFLQNIVVSEQGKANLASYNLLGRAGQLFSYGGADSRKITLDFEISVLHLFHLQEKEGLTERFKNPIKNTDRSQEILKFTSPSKANSKSHSYSKEARNTFLLALTGADSMNESVGTRKKPFQTAADFEANLQRYNKNPFDRNAKRPLPDYFQFENGDVDKTLDLVMYWINIIRSSVLNNSENTVYGPPIVRLSHGPLYMNSPCVVEDYKISIDQSSNYEVETLLPYTIKVSMSLLESRTGNFGGYESGKLIDGDNLAGWEAILDKNVLDAMNYNLEDFGDA